MKTERFPALIILCVCVLLASGCRQAASDGPAQSGVAVTDAEGKSVTVKDSSRIVAVGTANTETVYALGVGRTPAGKNRRVVAVSDIYLQGFGPSVGRAVRELALKLHTEAEAE